MLIMWIKMPCFSLRGDCRDAAKDPLYWISYKSGRCTTITSVNPAELQRTTARYVRSSPVYWESLTTQFTFGS